MRVIGFSGLTLAATCLAACGSDRSPRPASASVPTGAAHASNITVTATDFAFQAPSRSVAGVTTIHLKNNGKELHHAQLIRLKDGKSMEDLNQALKAKGPPPSWVEFVGGPNAVPPGMEANATTILRPGKYAWICFVFGPDLVMHAEKGMVLPFEVTGPETAAEKLPQADITITAFDYNFQSSKPLTPGRHTIRVENKGPQVHEVALLRLEPGKTVEDFGHWAETGMKGPPPAVPIGGVALLDKDGQGTFTVDLTPGNYGLICFVPDSKDGKPHLVHGMVKTIQVS